MDSSSNSPENSNAATYFNIFVHGQIESATFPMGPDATQIFCRYEVISGSDWEVCGVKSGITQSASNINRNFNDPIIFNMPIELTFKSTNPFGWPHFIICIYGKTRFNTETSLGYARCHLPMFGATNNEVVAPILIPKSTNMISEMINFITGKNPELRNPKILLDNSKNKGLSVESYGEIKLVLNCVCRGISRLGYDWQ